MEKKQKNRKAKIGPGNQILEVGQEDDLLEQAPKVGQLFEANAVILAKAEKKEQELKQETSHGKDRCQCFSGCSPHCGCTCSCKAGWACWN